MQGERLGGPAGVVDHHQLVGRAHDGELVVAQLQLTDPRMAHVVDAAGLRAYVVAGPEAVEPARSAASTRWLI